MTETDTKKNGSHAEMELLCRAEQYRLMFENNPMPMWVYDMETLKILDVNIAAQQKYGYSEEEFIAMTVLDLRPESEKSKFLDYYRRKNVTGFSGLWKHQKKSGETIDVEITAYPIVYHGRSAEFVMVTDVTERLKLEQQMRIAQKMESVGRLAGGIAHDFNNILGIVLAHSSFLQMQAGVNEKSKKSFDAIDTAVKRGAGIVKQLLQFSRKNETELQLIDINHNIAEMKELLKETMPRNIQIVQKLDESLPDIEIDSNQLQQVFLNLSVNARDAMPEGGALRFTTHVVDRVAVEKLFPKAAANRYVVVSVSDTGTGMPEEVKQKIFDPFFTTKPEGKGTGLGLPVVYGVVTGAGGFIDVASEAGRGTTFTLYFPVSERTNNKQNITIPAPDVEGREKRTILLVEDEELLGQLVETMLKDQGYTVLHARDGEEAVNIYTQQAHTIDLVLCDFGLPKLNGEKVLELIRAANPNARVILGSGYLEHEVKENLIKKGARDFIDKPFQNGDLMKKIQNALN